MFLRRLSPRRKIRKLRRFYAEIGHLIEVLPQGLIDIMEQVQSGKFDVHLEHRGLEPSVNRLVLGDAGQRPVPGLLDALAYRRAAGPPVGHFAPRRAPAVW